MRRNWRQAILGDRRALGASLLAHGVVIAALVFSIDISFPPKPETRTETTFSISLDKGDGMDTAIPKTSAPDPEPVKPEEVVPDPVKPAETKPAEIPQPSEASTSSSAAPSDSTVDANPGGGLLHWTPPPPNPFASGIGPGGAPREERRIEMPKVELPKGASDPVLLSYDQGRFSDAASMSEASRLMNTGTISMSVTVNAEGGVDQCVVTSTSGSPMLDQRACALVKSYRYRPAQDAQGKPHGALVAEVLEWARDGRFTDASGNAPAGAQAIRRADPAAPAPQPNVRMPVVGMPKR